MIYDDDANQGLIFPFGTDNFRKHYNFLLLLSFFKKSVKFKHVIFRVNIDHQ